MTLSIEDALQATRWMAALFVVLQTVELLSVRAALRDDGVWRAAWIRRDLNPLPWVVRSAIGPFIGYRPFVALLVLRLGLCALLVVAELGLVSAAGLVLSQLVVSARFRGSFNGGSDGMSLVVLMGLLLAALPLRSAGLLGLGYIAAQSLLSYWVAGLVKIKEADWRSGRALAAFSKARRYGIPTQLAALLARPHVALLGSWAVMLFECAFPLGLWRPEAMLAFTGVALAFHLGNWWVFGLNRFVFAWAATYPALIFVAGQVANR